MFLLSAYPAPVLRWRRGPVMSGFLTFMDRYRNEAACIAALAELRWPNGFICAGCAGRLAYQLAARPRVFECADCGRQHSVTAATVLHRTRTPLRKWFAAAWLIGQDKRGVSALFLARELVLRYDTAWLMAHKLRHGLSERDESYYGGRGKPESRGRGLADPNKSLMAIAVETVPASPRQGEGIKKSRFVAGSARIAVLPSATAADLGGFVRGAAKPGARIINITSVHEDWPMPGNTAYCLSKGGMRMLTRTAGVELAPHNILVMGVGPGAVATAINLSTMRDPAKMATLDAAIPLGRMARPEEIASVVAFLAGDGASYITATTIFADGGLMESSPGL